MGRVYIEPNYCAWTTEFDDAPRGLVLSHRGALIPATSYQSFVGLNLAETSVFISCAMTLAVFDIKKAIVNGKEVSPEVVYGTGTIR